MLKALGRTVTSFPNVLNSRESSCSPLERVMVALRNHQKRKNLAQRMDILHSTKKKMSILQKGI